MRRRLTSVCLKVILIGVLTVVGMLAVAPPPADAFCPKTSILGEILARTCWECLFPVSLAGVTLFSGTEDFTTPAVGPGRAAFFPPFLCGCVCFFGVCIPGLPLGLWEPKNLVEVVRTPFCIPSLGGITFGPEVTFYHRGIATTQQDDDSTHHNYVFYHTHFFNFPLWALLGLALDILCVNPGGISDEIDAIYMSEFDPTWKNDILTLVLFPEVLVINNPAATAACAADAIAASAGFPIDAMFWCAGSWGINYPPTGNVSGTHGGQLKPAALVMSRLLLRLSRVGTEFWTSAHGPLICDDAPIFQIVKSQYKFQMLYPIPNFSPKCCSPLGRTVFMWGLGHVVPVIGDDFVFLLWKLQRCCLL